MLNSTSIKNRTEMSYSIMARTHKSHHTTLQQVHLFCSIFLFHSRLLYGFVECIMNPFWHTFVFVTCFFSLAKQKESSQTNESFKRCLSLFFFSISCKWFYQLNDNETVKFKQELRITTILTECSALFCLLRWPLRYIVIN